MNRWLKFTIVYPLLSVLVWAATGNTATVSQSFTLKPGWNAIFLEVEPGNTIPSAVFSGINDLQSVWQWNARAGIVTVEFIQNPNLLVPSEPQMLVYLPPPADPMLSNLSAIQGNNAYLVQVGGSVDQILTVTGEPKIPRHNWKSNSFNLVGFHVANGLTTFGDFFSSSAAHAGQDIYVLNNATASWERIVNPSSELMLRGEAFWIYCKGSSTFNGPVSVTLELSSGLHFGKKLTEQEIYLHNNTSDPNPKTIILTLPALNDTVHYWVFDSNDGVASWEPMPASLALMVAPGDSQRVRIGVKRTGLPPDSDNQTNIGVSDGAGVSFLLPLSVTGIDYSGLWTGYATINKVSDVNKVDENGLQDMTELPTGSEFDFRLIIHAATSGEVRLLSQVIQMWQEGALKPDPDNLGKFVVAEPGEFVLFSKESLTGDFKGSMLRDGQQIGRRISAPAFPRLSGDNEVMTAAGSPFIPSPGSTHDLDITLAKDDATNPFLHLFHKTHGLAVNSIEVTRTISLTFADEDEEGNPITGLPSLNRGSSEIGGIYREMISGLNKLPIYIEGTFVLHRVSSIATLTQDPPTP